MLERILTLGFGSAKEHWGWAFGPLGEIRKAMTVYVEEKTDGEPLPVAPHEILAQLIQRAQRLIADPTNWFRLARKFHGQHCMETALSQVFLDTILSPIEALSPVEAHSLALTCVDSAVQRLYPNYHPHFTRRPALFNDLGSTTHEDVMLVMSIAAEIARQELGDLSIPRPEFLTEGTEFGPPSGS
jgi:hypothetical protein